MKEQLRVLISGINYAPNQFTRAIQRYGCDPVHVKGDPNDNFPRFCDAAIVVSSYTSHARYWAVKEAYKKMGKPVFLVGNGFSEIKESFETFLKTKRGFISLQPELQQVGELEVPVTWVETNNEIKETDMDTQRGFKKGQVPKRFDPADRAKINAIVRQGLAKNLKQDLIADQVNAAGFVKTNGTAFTNTDIASMKRQFLLAAGTYKQKNKSKFFKAEETPPAPAKTEPAPAPQAATPAFNPMDLIQKVTISQTLSPAEKIELIQRISLGEITTPEKIEVVVVDGNLLIEKTSILRPRSETPPLTLNREQADLVLAHIADIHKFVQGTLS